jgi:hypothetical protein
MLLRRIDLEESAAAGTALQAAGYTEPVVNGVDAASLEELPLSRDHPRWVKDAVAISARARELIAQMRPVVIRILTQWDHRLRTIAIGDRRVAVDTSGCYRVE